MTDLLSMLDEVVIRRKFRELQARENPGGREVSPPIICLVRQPGQEHLLSLLDQHYAGEGRGSKAKPARRALVKLEPPPEHEDHDDTEHLALSMDDVVRVAGILHSVVKKLESGRKGPGGRLRFHRFKLVRGLLAMNLPADDPRLQELVRGHMRSNEGLPPAEVAPPPPPSLPGWANLLVSYGPGLWFRMRLSAVVPWIGAKFWWLMRQPHLAPHDPGDLIGFGGRIASALLPASGHESDEDPNQVLLLLVNAFLEDIRQAYRGSPWRPRSARRTMHPVVLVNNITRDNGGYPLLRAINELRNGTALDQVVFISGSRKIPPDAMLPSQRDSAIEDIGNATEALKGWIAGLGVKSRKRKPKAWFLPLAVTSAKKGALPPKPFVAPPVPLWSRPVTLLVVTLLAAAGLVFAGARNVGAHCGELPIVGDYATLSVLDDGTPAGQCVGISEKPIPITGLAAAGHNEQANLDGFERTQKIIVGHNDRAAEIHEDAPDRPYITLVYFSAFSAERYTLASENERLMGVAARQREALDSGQEPLLRVVFANGGHQMQAGEQVAALIRELAEENRRVVGVIGFAQSRQATIDSVRAVGDAALPMVAATLSADVMPSISNLYFQVSPTNSRQAEVAARYLRAPGGLPVSGIRLVYSDDTSDTYSGNLRDIATETFRENGFAVTPEPFVPAGTKNENTQAVAEKLCALPPGEAVFFAGRPVDFSILLPAIGRCARDQPPRILASDDTSRYAADRGLLSDNIVPFEYISFGLGASGCSGNHGLYRNLQKIFAAECAAGLNPALNGHAALTYDATSVFVNAVAPGTNPSSVQILSKFYDTQFAGASGTINFRDSDVRGVPKDKFIAVMGTDPRKPDEIVELRGYCGVLPAGTDPALAEGVPDLCAS